MSPFSAIITPQSVSFTTPSGKVHNVDSSHKNWDEIIETIKNLQNAVEGEKNSGFYFGASSASFHDMLGELVDEAKKIEAAGVGKVTVVSGVVFYEDEAVHSAITERIIWGLGEGYDMNPYMAFLDNAMDNPSARAVDEMYSFMERNSMGITADGYILGYKKVGEDYKDLYTRSIDNSPGQIVEMKRNKVDDDCHRTCSKGLHFCSMSYLPKYGTSRGNKIVIVKVHPRDIVSVPIDYDCAKVRCCRYEVMSEYTGSDVEDLLGSKPIWSAEDFDDWNENDEDVFMAGEDDDDICDDCGCSEHNCLCDDEDAKQYDPLAGLLVVNPAPHAAPPQAPTGVSVDLTISADGDLHLHGAALSSEGEDMRHIMDTVETPVSPEAAAIRKLIDTIEEPPPEKISDETRERLQQLESDDMSGKARELLQQLYNELNKGPDQ